MLPQVERHTSCHPRAGHWWRFPGRLSAWLCQDRGQPRAGRTTPAMRLMMCLLMTAAGCSTDDPAAVPAAAASAEQPADDAAGTVGAATADETAHEGTADDGTDAEAAARLSGLLRSRLALMDDVARWKWAARKPVSDPAREEQLLMALVQQGQTAGLDAERVTGFFRRQFAASRLRQQQLFEQWQQTDGPHDDRPAPDLQQVLRPRITRLSTELLQLLADIDHRAAARPAAMRSALLHEADALSAATGASVAEIRNSLRDWAAGLSPEG